MRAVQILLAERILAPSKWPLLSTYVSAHQTCRSYPKCWPTRTALATVFHTSYTDVNNDTDSDVTRDV